jgi:tRNA A37 methylthiotransferase MiaB
MQISRTRGRKRDFRIRLGMANPLYLRDQWEEWPSRTLGRRSSDFFSFRSNRHDAVLISEPRLSAAEWIELCQRFLARVPDLTLATDLIVASQRNGEDFSAPRLLP